MTTHPYGLAERADVYAALPAGACRVLDVGCSRGGFCELVKRRRPNATVWGIEPDREAAVEASKRADHVITGHFPGDLPHDAGPFDAIVFADVLEHLICPGDALRAAVSYLSPTGVVVASIPNVRHWSALRTIFVRGDFPTTDTGLFDGTHIRWFTRSTMLELFENSGLVAQACIPTSISNRLAARGLRMVAPSLGTELSALQFIIVGRPEDTH
jgi:2-polyprenyl-3-methyl-5-hydroxy-6-metoxy-1,4-benzoquinol methylase